KSKSYTTPLGTFEYNFLGHRRYTTGITQKNSAGGNFLIATPEKALADLVHKKSRHLGSKDLLIDLVEGRRIDEEDLKNLDKSHLTEIAENYRSTAVNNLLNAIGRI
ncbi:MAG: hypothetical protein JSS12_00295, partial [Verrucomicrobia bacterium]|nr:hypothetical protein [Verrucomicrobiota bacterium]